MRIKPLNVNAFHVIFAQVLRCRGFSRFSPGARAKMRLVRGCSIRARNPHPERHRVSSDSNAALP